jgi:transposase
MGKTHSIELRERVVAFVDEGNSHRDAARHFRVSPKFVNDMVKLRRETGALLAKPQGNLGRTGKLNGLSAWVRERLAAQGDLTRPISWAPAASMKSAVQSNSNARALPTRRGRK